jgi:hypothetical protein
MQAEHPSTTHHDVIAALLTYIGIQTQIPHTWCNQTCHSPCVIHTAHCLSVRCCCMLMVDLAILAMSTLNISVICLPLTQTHVVHAWCPSIEADWLASNIDSHHEIESRPHPVSSCPMLYISPTDTGTHQDQQYPSLWHGPGRTS